MTVAGVEREVLRSCPLKVPEKGLHVSLNKCLSPRTQDSVPGSYREPLVHIELVTRSQDAASGGPLARFSPCRAWTGTALPAQGCHVHWGNFHITYL